MRETMWIYVVILFLSETQSVESGTTESTPANTTFPPITERRDAIFNNGRDVNLTCSDKMWNETFYVIWTIELINKDRCTIKFNSDGQNTDTCNDGKSLRNTSSAQPYLHIPKFSKNDVGIYTCEFAYRGGATNCKIYVNITVTPVMKAWLEHKDNITVAICIAENGNPAANISWSHARNSSVEQLPGKNGCFTVVSRLELPEGMPKNLSCTISHQNLTEILFPEFQKVKVYYIWLYALIAGIIIAFMAGVLFFVVTKLRQHQQSDTSSSKSPPIEDVEEVEPYASYVQRVNSIYN
ncbi:cell surface glycoprotein CD200 receptor 1-A isoform X1 [Simochromis diagramma]|uniref:cell surface glycoprotein CD200 receptor 1-A isoform X1 n=1 Tax=Simochromis diagramma TaxID=43689 RepID=UPI001A7EDFCF|nr:cell surface glycoprotein CD200 receptor 1-A isoform X1 [Simochromis diagramma]